MEYWNPAYLYKNLRGRPVLAGFSDALRPVFRAPCYLLLAIALPASGANLESLIVEAIEQDPWRSQSQAMERATRAEAIVSGELPDPRFTASVANLPTDTFDFSQEPMTQVMVGFSQTFPGGDTRQLSRQRLNQMSDVSIIERDLRRAQLRQEITLLWAEAALADETLALIEQDRPLFNQLESVVSARYRSAEAGANQQDLIRAQLEVARLDERVLRLKAQRERLKQQLTEWVPPSSVQSVRQFNLPKLSLPNHSPPNHSLSSLNLQKLEIVSAAKLIHHPELKVHDQRIEIARTGYALAEESKRPGVTLNTAYGYRDEDRTGRELPDFLSVGLSMDLPFFTGKRQDKKITAAAERVAAEESARLLTLQKLTARYRDATTNFAELEAQINFYESNLLQQLVDMSQAALAAYGADQADFAEVMRARIAELNARIELLKLKAAQQKTLAELQYLAGSTQQTGETS